MNVFLDANVLVSVLNKEYPLFSYSSRILSLTEDKRFRIYTSPVCLAIAFYFAEKKSGSVMAKKKMEVLTQKIHITNVGGREVLDSLHNKKVLDFEDGLEYYSAIQSKCSVIITENVSDFHFSGIEVHTSQQFIEKHVI